MKPGARLLLLLSSDSILAQIIKGWLKFVCFSCICSMCPAVLIGCIFLVQVITGVAYFSGNWKRAVSRTWAHLSQSRYAVMAACCAGILCVISVGGSLAGWPPPVKRLFRETIYYRCDFLNVNVLGQPCPHDGTDRLIRFASPLAMGVVMNVKEVLHVMTISVCSLKQDIHSNFLPLCPQFPFSAASSFSSCSSPSWQDS